MGLCLRHARAYNDRELRLEFRGDRRPRNLAGICSGEDRCNRFGGLDGIGPGRRQGWIDRGYLRRRANRRHCLTVCFVESARTGRGFWLFDSRWQPNLLRNRSRRFGAVVSAQAMVCVEIIELENRVCRGRPDKSRLDTSLPAMKISAAAKLGLTRTLELTASRRTTSLSMTSTLSPAAMRAPARSSSALSR